MKARLMVPSLIACTVALTAALPAFSDRPAGAAEDTELAKAMDGMKAAMRGLRRIVEKPEKKADALALVAQLQQHVAAAKILVPPNAAKLEGKAREEFISGYRRGMIALLSKSIELELDILDGRTADAAKRWKELITLRDKGHGTFNKEGERP